LSNELALATDVGEGLEVFRCQLPLQGYVLPYQRWMRTQIISEQQFVSKLDPGCRHDMQVIRVDAVSIFLEIEMVPARERPGMDSIAKWRNPLD